MMLPGESGENICRRLRQESNIPIVMLTAKGEEIDKVSAVLAASSRPNLTISGLRRARSARTPVAGDFEKCGIEVLAVSLGFLVLGI
jgi:CheY-like chemotaxis protein